MRVLKLASLILLASTWSFACNSDDGGGDGDGDGDSGVGATSGTGASTGAGGTTGTGSTVGDGDGDGDATTHPDCTNTAVATGTPTMIDDFNGDAFPNLVDDSDGRIGTWAHGHWISPAGSDPSLIREAGMGGGPGYLEAECQDEADDQGDYPWCNTEFNPTPETDWEQWASVDLRLALYSATDVNCYDASVFTGIKFKAKSAAEGNSFRIQLGTPDAKPNEGETYQSGELQLGTTEWEEFEVPFSMIAQPSWSSVTAPLDVRGLITISWAVRTVTPQDVDGIVGETLAPYNIQIDDVEFY